MRAPRLRRQVGVTTAAMAALMIVGSCTSLDDSAGAHDGPADEATLKQYYDGDYQPPPTTGPKAVPGKDVWIISCGQAFAQCSRGSAAFKNAGTTLGWDVTIVDSKANPAKANELIKQGVAAGVDGIAVYALDCPTIKGGLVAAKKADIPTVNFAGLDCDADAFDGGEPLFTQTLNTRGGDSFENYAAQYQRARADVLLAYAGQDAKILNLQETSLTNSAIKTKVFTDRIEQECPNCEIIPVKWSYSQVPTAATQIWKSAIQQHPEATVLSNDVDDVMALGLQSALRQSSRPDLMVIGSEGPEPALNAIREGTQTASLAIKPGYAWQMWGLADTLNRVFAGSHEFPDVGGGWTLVDKNHNLPAEGDSIEVPDFMSAFKKFWLR